MMRGVDGEGDAVAGRRVELLREGAVERGVGGQGVRAEQAVLGRRDGDGHRDRDVDRCGVGPGVPGEGGAPDREGRSGDVRGRDASGAEGVERAETDVGERHRDRVDRDGSVCRDLRDRHPVHELTGVTV
ncbi:hypothetical protein DEJ36_09740 [Curtobacterium sp. MCPF17_052]|nr:hypothetical protein [Curtobacterium sp. MCPF17_052]WIB11345.1 hypothetical protein DEJ36_09740 [Curtobacterium sp. MCPF17_052]